MRVIAILILIGGVALGLKSSTEDLAGGSSEAVCLSEIKKSDALIESSNGSDSVVAQVSKSAVTQCLADFGDKQIDVYNKLAGFCEKSFGDVQGTTSEAMKSYCQLNGIRYVLSLQLQRQK